MAQLSIDNGVRAPRAMMVSGNSVIDDKGKKETDKNSAKEDRNDDDNEDDDNDDLPVAELISDDVDTLGDSDGVSAPIAPIDPFVAAPDPITKPNIKQELKKIPTVKVKRSIADDRIDDGYVQGLIKNNSTFTPDID